MPAALRQARASDLDQLVALEDAAFAGDRLGRQSFRRLIASPTARLVVAERANRLAGYCLVLFRDGAPAARLYSIAVHPDFAGIGVGRLLLGAAERAAFDRGRRALRLEVREDNPAAIGLYERHGYRRIGRAADYYQDGAAALRFEKALGSRPPCEPPRSSRPIRPTDPLRERLR